jgi:uncharacterized membrane protein
MDLVHVGATWLHLLATVAMIGYYAFLGRVVLPVLRRFVPAAELGESIAAVERHALPVIVASLAIFLVTGVYLMGIDPAYGGLGKVTGSSWATLLLVKHLVVAVMVGVGVYLDALIMRRPPAGAEGQAPPMRRIEVAVAVMTALGVLVLLLTAAAQVG